LPQFTIAVEMGEIKTLNPHTIKAKRKAKWPPQGQPTECEDRPDWSPRGVLHKHDWYALKGTGTCKPEDEQVILKSAAHRKRKQQIAH